MLQHVLPSSVAYDQVACVKLSGMQTCLGHPVHYQQHYAHAIHDDARPGVTDVFVLDTPSLELP